MCGRGKGGMGLGAMKTKASKTKTISKKTKTSKKTKAQREKALAVMIEKEYVEHMALPASEDKLWYSSSREDVEKALEENYGKWRNIDGSKYCRQCFGYGVSIMEEACEGCTYDGMVRKYLGNGEFERQYD